MLQSLGNNSGQLANSPLEEIVVIRMPTVARIRGEGSPIAERHSLRMKSATVAGNLWKWARTLFFNIKPLRDLVGSSMSDSWKQIISIINRLQNIMNYLLMWAWSIQISSSCWNLDICWVLPISTKINKHVHNNHHATVLKQTADRSTAHFPSAK